MKACDTKNTSARSCWITPVSDTSKFCVFFENHVFQLSVVWKNFVFQLFFLPELPTNYREASLDSSDKQNWLIFALTNRGVHWRNSLTNCR